MESVAIESVKPGAVLAAPVTDVRGNVLAGEGRVLSEEWIARLKARGVVRVQVRPEGGPAAAASAAPSAAVEARLKLHDERFARAPHDELMQALATAARQVLSERKS